MKNNCLAERMIDAWVDGERIEIRGLDGSDLHHRVPRSARNPKTDEAINLPAKSEFILNRVRRCGIE